MGKGGQKVASGPEMKAAWKLYDAGDKVAARREAQGVLRDSPPDAEKQQAADLLERTGFPKMGYVLAAVSAALILAMVVLALTRT
jgi:hypothetical protein